MAAAPRSELWPHLPPEMREYPLFPRRKVLPSFLIVLLLIAAARFHGTISDQPLVPSAGKQDLAPHDPAPSVPDLRLSTFGQISVSLSLHDGLGTITAGNYSGAVLRKVSDQLFTLGYKAKLPIATLTMNADGTEMRLEGGQGGNDYIIKTDDDGYKVLSSARSLLQRVKIKEDKFNVYDASGNRTLRGKEKNGGIVVKDERDVQRMVISWSGRLDNPLRRSSCFALSLPPHYITLMFFQAVTSVNR